MKQATFVIFVAFFLEGTLQASPSCKTILANLYTYYHDWWHPDSRALIPKKLSTDTYLSSGLSRNELLKILGIKRLNVRAANKGKYNHHSVYHAKNILNRAFEYLHTVKRATPSEKKWGSVAAKRYRILRDLLSAYSSIDNILWVAHDTRLKDGSFFFTGRRGESIIIRASDGAIFRGNAGQVLQGKTPYAAMPDFSVLVEIKPK